MPRSLRERAVHRMAKAPQHRPAARRPPRETDEVIELATGDIEADVFDLEADESTAVRLPPTKILPSDPQRAVATTVYGPEHLEAPPSAETHVFDLPEEEDCLILKSGGMAI